MPEFFKNLHKEARVAATWRIIFISSVALGACVGLLAFFDFVDRYLPWKEASIAPILLGATGILGLIFILLAARAYSRRPKPRDLAAKVEDANPELMDTLNCAVDLIEKKDGELNPMEERVLKVAAEKADSSTIAKATRPEGRTKCLVLLALGLACGLIAYGLRWSPVEKTLAHFSGLPGMEITTRLSALEGGSENPPDWEYARGSDVSIFANVLRSHRGTKDASLEYEQSGRLHSVQMLSTSEAGRFEFIAPSLREKLRYRVTTPSLNGEWHELTPYSPPELHKVTWKVSPPKYTGLPAAQYEGFTAQKVPQDSVISLEAVVGELPLNVIASVLHEDESRLPIKKGPDGLHLLARNLAEPWKGRIELRDADAPTRDPVISDEFSFKVIRDEPPVVEITEPGKDLELPAESNLLIEFFAADDYGLADAEIIVSHGGKPTTTNVFVEPVEKEKTITHVLSLGEMSLAVGDVVAYHVVVSDNKEPEAQKARSEIYFIEVLPPQGDPMEGGEGMEGEQKEVPVRDFINRTKQIIRSTYDALAEEGKEQEDRAVEITSEALSLKHDMTKVYDEFDGQFPVVDGIDTAELLNEATYFIEQTEIFAGDGELQESLEPSGETLRKLVLLYALLRQNPMKGKGEGKEKSESEEEQTEQEKSDENAKDQPKDPAEQLKALGEALEQAQELRERQQDLNGRIGRAARNGKKGEVNERMAKEQDEIEKDLDDLRDDLYDQSGRLGDVRSLEQAGGEMKKSEKELDQDDPAGAKPHGIRAAEALTNAEQEIEGRMLAAGAAMLEALEKEGQGLAQQQQENSAKTEGAQPGEGKELQREQDRLNQATKDLLSKMEKAGLALRELNENATEDLFGAADEAREDGIESSGKRASNALLYEAFPRAKKEEDKVARELGEAADKIGDVKRKLANQGNLALKELIEGLKKEQAELPGKGDQEMREMAKEVGEQIGALPEAEGDRLLQDIISFFDKVAYDEKASRSKTAANHALTDAIDRLEEYFWKEAAQEQIRRNHETTSAPRKYKRQVEEYFRRIAEGE